MREKCAQILSNWFSIYCALKLVYLSRVPVRRHFPEKKSSWSSSFWSGHSTFYHSLIKCLNSVKRKTKESPQNDNKWHVFDLPFSSLLSSPLFPINSSVPVRPLWRKQQQQLSSVQPRKFTQCERALWGGVSWGGGARQEHTLPRALLHLSR